MKYSQKIIAAIMLLTSLQTQAMADENAEKIAHQITLTSQEIEAILEQKEVYSYFGPELGEFIDVLPQIHAKAHEHGITTEAIDALCASITNGHKTAPHALLEGAIVEAHDCLEQLRNILPADELAQYAEIIKEYTEKLTTKSVDLLIKYEKESVVNPESTPAA